MVLLKDVFELPNDLLVSLFAEWTNDKNLTRLDSACCNLVSRRLLFELLQCDSFTLEGKDESSNIYDHFSYNKWIQSRRVKTRKAMFFWEHISIQISPDFNLSKTVKLELIGIEFDYNVSIILLNNCSSASLKDLSMCHLNNYNDIVNSMDEGLLRNLERLFIRTEPMRPILIITMEKIIKCCHNLDAIKLGDFSINSAILLSSLLQNNRKLTHIRLESKYKQSVVG